MLNDVTVFNICEYLSAKGDKDLGEDELRQLLSEFFCDKNPDVERFLKEQSIEFTKKNQSVAATPVPKEKSSIFHGAPVCPRRNRITSFFMAGRLLSCKQMDN